MGNLIKVLRLHWSYLRFLFIFRDILKGVHTIVTIFHQFGVLKAPVIQKFFYWHFIFKSNYSNYSPNFLSFYSICTRPKYVEKNICMFIYIYMYKYMKIVHSIYIQKEKGLYISNLQGLSIIYCFNGDIRKRKPIMQDSI